MSITAASHSSTGGNRLQPQLVQLLVQRRDLRLLGGRPACLLALAILLQRPVVRSNGASLRLCRGQARAQSGDRLRQGALGRCADGSGGGGGLGPVHQALSGVALCLRLLEGAQQGQLLVEGDGSGRMSLRLFLHLRRGPSP